MPRDYDFAVRVRACRKHAAAVCVQPCNASTEQVAVVRHRIRIDLVCQPVAVPIIGIYAPIHPLHVVRARDEVPIPTQLNLRVVQPRAVSPRIHILPCKQFCLVGPARRAGRIRPPEPPHPWHNRRILTRRAYRHARRTRQRIDHAAGNHVNTAHNVRSKRKRKVAEVKWKVRLIRATPRPRHVLNSVRRHHIRNSFIGHHALKPPTLRNLLCGHAW